MVYKAMSINAWSNFLLLSLTYEGELFCLLGLPCTVLIMSYCVSFYMGSNKFISSLCFYKTVNQNSMFKRLHASNFFLINESLFIILPACSFELLAVH